MDTKTYILGISAFYHDSAACLVADGQIIAAAQEERFTRKKNDPSFPRHAIDYCLKQAGITMDDITHVGFYEKPFLTFERLLLSYLNCAPSGFSSFVKAMPLWFKEKIFLKDLLAKELKYSDEIIFCHHHQSHAASAFFPSPFKSAAIITMDGVGEWATTSLWVGEENSMRLDKEIHFPHSLGLLYSSFTAYCGFRVNSGEYKLMGLAPYGDPKYANIIKEKLIDIKADGSFKLNMEYFNYCVGNTMTNEKFHKLFNAPARIPESELTQFHMDIARSIQEVLQEVIVKIANHAYEITGKENLCLAGGVALNCVANSAIKRLTQFKEIWVQPAAGDSGGALGVALVIWHQYLSKPRDIQHNTDKQHGSFLGPYYDDLTIEDFLKSKNIKYKKYAEPEIFNHIAQLIDDGNVIGLFQGRMEFGPRALGNRSIIADARKPNMQQKINQSVKFRENFRPFAPSVLTEHALEYFNLSKSPYMMFVGEVQPGQMAIPAVTHVDKTARIQTVDAKEHPFFYKTIKAFYQRTGTPLVLNTSFNVRGEPIVNSPQDAYRCFIKTNMDYLILNQYVIDKKELEGYDIS